MTHYLAKQAKANKASLPHQPVKGRTKVGAKIPLRRKDNP
jgi:hypothetical protein